MDRSVRLLHVDDSFTDGELLQIELKRSNFTCEVKFVATREEYCVELVRGGYDVILSDFRMGPFDGDQALALAKQKLPDVPFILVTGELGEEFVIERLKRGVADYVLKDNMKRLIPAIERTLRESEDRKRRLTAEVMAKEGEDRFRAFVTATSDVVYSMNPDWSEMRSLVGPDFIADMKDPSKTWMDKYIPPDDQPLVKEAIRQAIKTKSIIELEHRVIRVDGSLGWVFSRAIPLLDEKGEIVEWFGAARDITQQKESQQQLVSDLNAMTRLQKLSMPSAQDEHLEPLLAEIVDAAIAISEADFGNIQLLDPASGDLCIVAQRGFPEWWLEFWNSVSKGMGSCGTALERNERVIVQDVEQSPIFAGTPALEIQRKAGVRAVQSTPLFSRSGKPVGMFSTHYKMPRRPNERALRLLDLLARQAADIIDNAHAEKALRHSEERYRRLFTGMQEGYLLAEMIDNGPTKPIDFRYLDINPAAERILGLKREQVVGKTAREIIPDVKEEDLQMYANVVRTGEPQRREFFQPMFKQHHENFAFCPAPGQVAVLFWDITERKRLEEERNAALTREQTERKAAEHAKAKAEQELGERKEAEEALGKWTSSPLPGEELSRVRRYGVSLGVMAGCLLVRQLSDPMLGDHLPYITVFGGIALAIWYGGMGPALLSSFIGYLAATWLFISPRYQFDSHPYYFVGLFLFLLSSFAIAFLGDKMRRAQRHARQSARVAVERQKRTETEMEKRLHSQKALEQSEDQLRITMDIGRVGTYFHDFTTGEMRWSAATRQLFGVGPEENVTQEMASGRIHPDDREQVMKAAHESWDQKHDGRFEAQYRVIRPDGSIRWIGARGNTVFVGEDGTRRILYSIGAVVDITEQKQAEERIRWQRDQLHLLQSAMNSVYAADSLEAVYAATLDGIISSVGADRASILLFDSHKKVHFKAWRNLSDGYRAAVDGHCPWSIDELSATPILMPDIAQEESLGDVREVILGEGIHACGFFPLRGHRQLLGKFMVYFNTTHNFTTEETGLLEAIATTLSLAIQRWRNQSERDQQLQQYRLSLQAANQRAFEHELSTGILTWSPLTDGMAIFDPAHPNPSAEEWNAMVLPEDRDKLRNSIIHILEKGTECEVEYRVRAADASIRWVVGHGRSIKGPDGKATHVSGLIQDITERKQAEQVLREKEKELETIINRSPFLLTRCSRDLRYRFVSNAYAAMIDRLPEDIIGKPIVEVMGEDGLNTIRPHIKRVLQGEVVRYEAPVHFKGIGERHLSAVYTPDMDLSGNVIGWVASIVDVTDRTLADIALRESEERFRLATSAGAVGVWDWNIVSNVVSWSDSIYEIHGVRRGEFDGTVEGFASLVHPDDRAIVNEAIQQALRGSSEYELEFRAVRPDGATIWIYTKAQVVRDASGAPVRMLGSTVDITRRKKAEEELVSLNQELDRRVLRRTEELVRANKELDAFTYSVSHDLKAPLRALSGFVSMLETEETHRLSVNGKHYIDVITRSARHMNQLVEDLLSFSRFSRQEMDARMIDMREIFTSVVEELRQSEGARKVEVKIHQLPMVKGDSGLLRQVATNLLANAFKFTREKAEATIEIGSIPHDSECIYYVKDNGAGFNAEYAGRLFQVFQRLHQQEEFEGTGVGLSIVRRIIERHGGRVWADGKVDGGATFYFSVPAGK